MWTQTTGDELLRRARDLIVDKGEVSICLLQRHFKLGHQPALVLMARLETARVVTPPSVAGVRMLASQYARRTSINELKLGGGRREHHGFNGNVL